jgi:hypothetical protein
MSIRRTIVWTLSRRGTNLPSGASKIRFRTDHLLRLAGPHASTTPLWQDCQRPPQPLADASCPADEEYSAAGSPFRRAICAKTMTSFESLVILKDWRRRASPPFLSHGENRISLGLAAGVLRNTRPRTSLSRVGCRLIETGRRRRPPLCVVRGRSAGSVRFPEKKASSTTHEQI